ncbi:hypothetical protein AVEN_76043-1 [Araneus ventricosus]|uniref:Uncharacterized protein n=1 Tax=Araneus ventricosus TaxID=182803 RepID=A0A4Y2TFB6_ARAVE|nr:hypothetical protein AVEN_238139-1 [Araneus ventricosus]GBN98941.1 hypothetical protein AVEN_76043-1 [Araneus ventricosus]
MVVPRCMKSTKNTTCLSQKHGRHDLTYFAFTHGSSSVNFTNLPVNVCSRQVSCREKMYDRPYLAWGGRFDNLEHFKDTEQTVQVTYTAAIEHSCSQGMPGHDASNRCCACATY